MPRHASGLCCVICWDGPGKSPDQRMGINTRLLDRALMADVPVKVLDGDGPGARSART